MDITLLLTSKGLNTILGKHLFKEAILQVGFKSLTNLTIGLISHPYYEAEETLIAACRELGFEEENIIILNSSNISRKLDFLYCGEGNTFLTLKYLHSTGLFDYVKESVHSGVTYLGASCGAALCGSDINLISDFDTPVPMNNNLRGWNFLEETAIIPHYNYQQLKKYMETTELWRLAAYQDIMNISNDEVVIIRNRIDKKRIRLD